MSQIIKTIVTLTILHQSHEHGEENIVSDMSLGRMARFIEDGDGIGDYTVTFVDAVSPDDVNAELVALGNDGTFFDIE